MIALPDAAAVERFRHDWQAATGADHARKALIALSGGADSSALLLLFAAARGSAQPFAAATVDHRLRAASAGEAAQAARLARACGTEHAILTGDLPGRVGPTANVSARARALRYDSLAQHADAIGAWWIVTAHHADDQLETMVMRLNRGSGIRGLAGVRQQQGRIVRPLLGWRRSELAKVAAEAGVVAVHDPSNADDRFDRARLRKQLAGAGWLDAVAASRSAAALAEAEAALHWSAERAFQQHCVPAGSDMIFNNPAALPAELRRRLVERCIHHLAPDLMLRGGVVTRLIERLSRRESATIGSVIARPTTGRLQVGLDHAWHFRAAPPRRSP